MNTSLLKEIINHVANPLNCILNKCLQEGKFPRKLKVDIVLSIHKMDDINCCNNRPVSLLHIFSKLFEEVLKRRLLNFLESSLNCCQHGFNPGRSITTALTSLMNGIAQAFDAETCCEILVCDLNKVLYSVITDILLAKLEYHGVRGIALDECISILYRRKRTSCEMEERAIEENLGCNKDLS